MTCSLHLQISPGEAQRNFTYNNQDTVYTWGRTDPSFVEQISIPFMTGLSWKFCTHTCAVLLKKHESAHTCPHLWCYTRKIKCVKIQKNLFRCKDIRNMYTFQNLIHWSCPQYIWHYMNSNTNDKTDSSSRHQPSKCISLCFHANKET